MFLTLLFVSLIIIINIMSTLDDSHNLHELDKFISVPNCKSWILGFGVIGI